jgi:hypothetical protein
MNVKYWLHPKIKWKNFKVLNDKLYPNPDIKPMHADRIIWQLLKDRRINICIEDSDDPVCLTLKNIPKQAVFIK